MILSWLWYWDTYGVTGSGRLQPWHGEGWLSEWVSDYTRWEMEVGSPRYSVERLGGRWNQCHSIAQWQKGLWNPLLSTLHASTRKCGHRKTVLSCHSFHVSLGQTCEISSKTNNPFQQQFLSGKSTRGGREFWRPTGHYTMFQSLCDN